MESELNDIVSQGPDLVKKLAGALLRFRRGQIVITVDVESTLYKMKVKQSTVMFGGIYGSRRVPYLFE